MGFKVFLLLVVFTASFRFNPASAHGRLEEPPARNYLWRLGFPNPANFDDVGLNCGGFANQWNVFGGRCGVCGDPYQGPRLHEAGTPNGYANGIVGRIYTKGDRINISVAITANHQGYFQFRVCPVADPNVPVTQECLDKYLLQGRHGETKFPLSGNHPFLHVNHELQLPKGLTCDHCVMQWWYTAGNNLPGAPQENFVNCADIAIVREAGVQPAPPNMATRAQRKQVIDSNDVRDPDNWTCEVVAPYNKGERAESVYDWCLNSCVIAKSSERHCPPTHCHCVEKNQQGSNKSGENKSMRPTKPALWLVYPKLDPEYKAKREERLRSEYACKVVAPYDKSKKLHDSTYQWCITNCLLAEDNQRNCQLTHCMCRNKKTNQLLTTSMNTGSSTIRNTAGIQTNSNNNHNVQVTVPDDYECKVVGAFNKPVKRKSMYKWCVLNCLNAPAHDRNCPPTHCDCYQISTGKKLHNDS